MEIPKEVRDRVVAAEKIENQRQQKRQASLHYKRRKLDKDVRRYIRDANPIRLKSIEAIGRRHKFYTV